MSKPIDEDVMRQACTTALLTFSGVVEGTAHTYGVPVEALRAMFADMILYQRAGVAPMPVHVFVTMALELGGNDGLSTWKLAEGLSRV